MEQKFTYAADPSAPRRPAASVTVLSCRQNAILDAGPIDEIVAQKGVAAAEALICRVLEDIAYRLDALQLAKEAHAFDQIITPARRLSQIAGQIGLIDVARTASHLTQVARARDGVALYALAARLERGFDSAVSEIWAFRDRHPP